MRQAFFAVIIAILSSIHAVSAQGVDFGKTDYVRNCASCHGLDGKGNETLSKSFTTKPADLTKLSEVNKGVFPISRVYDLIDGRINVLAHGSRDMPVWGQKFKEEVITKMGRDSTLGPEWIEAMVRMRILSLVEYISTMQAK